MESSNDELTDKEPLSILTPANKKIYIPFPEEDEKAQISWLLNHVRVTVEESQVRAYCYVSPEITPQLKSWFDACAGLNGISFHTKKYHRQILIRVGSGFISWLEDKAKEYELNLESEFHKCLNEKRAAGATECRQERKIHTPFPTEEKDIIDWLLNHCRAIVRNRIYITAFCLTNSPNADKMQTWLSTLVGIEMSKRQYGNQLDVRLGTVFPIWLESKMDNNVLNFNSEFHKSIHWRERKAADYSLTVNSKFHMSLQATKKKVEINDKERENVKQKIISMIEEKYGRKGCNICGTYNNLEFDHVAPSTKSACVSLLLYQGKFEAAEYEGVNFCQILCTQHHREKTIRNKDWVSPRIKPASENPRTVRHRDKTRIYSEKIRDTGKERLLKAKLKIGKCSQCPLLCTEENAHHFDFHHRDPNKKLFYISALTSRCDNLFYAELPECDVICVSCHKKETQHQHEQEF